MNDRFDLSEPVPLVLESPNAVALQLAVTRLDIADDVFLFAAVGPEGADLIRREQLLHVGDAFDDAVWIDYPISLQLRLDRGLSSGATDGETLLAELFGTDDGPLAKTQAWYLLEATQPLEPERPAMVEMTVGVRTKWADT